MEKVIYNMAIKIPGECQLVFIPCTSATPCWNLLLAFLISIIRHVYFFWRIHQQQLLPGTISQMHQEEKVYWGRLKACKFVSVPEKVVFFFPSFKELIHFLLLLPKHKTSIMYSF